MGVLQLLLSTLASSEGFSDHCNFSASYLVLSRESGGGGKGTGIPCGTGAGKGREFIPGCFCRYFFGVHIVVKCLHCLFCGTALLSGILCCSDQKLDGGSVDQDCRVGLIDLVSN